MQYTDSHEWILIQKQRGRAGITAYAQKELGEVIYIELPQLGRQVRAGEEICVLESTKAAVDVYSPVSGTIVAIHEELKQDPSPINQAPETSGWLFEIELSHPEEMNRLLTHHEYQKLIEVI